MNEIKPIPDDMHTITPYLNIEGAARLIDFLKQAFGAQELHRLEREPGSIMHAHLRIGDSNLMISDACQQMPPMPSSLYLYVQDADATYRRALEAGATAQMEPADMFWGDRMASVNDPAGNTWSIATQVQIVPPEQIPERAQQFMQQQG